MVSRCLCCEHPTVSRPFVRSQVLTIIEGDNLRALVGDRGEGDDTLPT